MAKKEKPRGWVATAEGTTEELCFASPESYKNADAAVRGFCRTIGEHFDLYFRNSKGVLCSCADESRPEHFD